MHQEQHLDQRRDLLQKRLQVLELQQARLGYETPAHTQLEIEDIRGQLAEIDKTLEGIKGLAAQAASAGEVSANASREPNPYRGLEPFEAEHAEFYFGRAEMVAQLVAQVKASSFVALVGPSGSGKSSLVRAGLVSALGKGQAPASQSWAVRFFRPGTDPLRALALPLITFFRPEPDDVELMAKVRKLATSFYHGKLSLVDIAGWIRDRRRDTPRLVLVADQFEELYTECRDPKLRERFIATLLSGINEPNLVLVLTLRADFYGHVLEHRALGQALNRGLLNILPMSEEELVEAIEQPALKLGRQFEMGLVRRILNDVLEEPGNLPLLEFALDQLWQRQTDAGLLTHAAYEASGGVTGSIAERAEAAYATMSERNQAQIVQQIFLRLTHYTDGVKGTRRRAVIDDLVTPGAPRTTVEQVVLALANARLLVTAHDRRTGMATAEVAHEALIRNWPRLTGWLDQDRAFGLWRERLAVARQSWEEKERDEGVLLRGALLSEAAGWLEGRGDALNEAERAFIQAGLELRDREAVEREALRQRELAAAQKLTEETEARRQLEVVRAREFEESVRKLTLRNRVGIALFGVVVLLGLFATLNALEARRGRDAAERQSSINAARELKSRALAQIDVNAECALTLALEGYDQAHAITDFSRYEFEDVVRNTLSHTRVEATLTGHAGEVFAVAWSSTGQLATAGQDRTVRIWNAETGAPRFVLSGHPAPVSAVAWSPDGRQLASGDASGSIRLWDAGTGKLIATLDGAVNVLALAYSPRGHRLAAAAHDGAINLWDVAASRDPDQQPGRLINSWWSHDGPVFTLAWSPNGQWLASGSEDNYIKIWSASREVELASANLGGQVTGLAWSPGGNQLVAVGLASKINLWYVSNQASTADISLKLLALTSTNIDLLDVVWSPTTQQLATAGANGTIQLWDILPGSNAGVTTTQLIAAATLTGHTGSTPSLDWSPDGTQLASASYDGSLRLWRLDEGNNVKIWRSAADNVLDTAWSSDGRWLASAESGVGYGHKIALWNPSTGERTTLATPHSSSIRRVALHPDNDRLASVGADSHGFVYNLRGETLAELQGHTSIVSDVAWSPDGQYLATASEDHTVRIWDATTAQSLAILRGHTDPVNGLAWSPDGKRLASASTDYTVRIWEVEQALRPDPGAEARPRILTHDGLVTSVVWSPDGQRLAAGLSGGAITVWDSTSGTPLDALRGHSAVVWDLAWSSHDDVLASAAVDGTVRLWDMERKEAVAVLTGHTGAVRAVAWSPDGRLLASAGLHDHTVRVAFARFEADVLPLARVQHEHGSTPAERAACLDRREPEAPASTAGR